MFKRNLSAIVCLGIILSLFASNMVIHRWKNENRVIESDVTYYYLYLPAAFIYHDIGFTFLEHRFQHYPKFAPVETETGKYMSKVSMGVAIMYSPFFFVAHTLSEPLGFEPDGYSLIYRMVLSFGTIVYFGIALLFLRRFLLKYFEDKVVAITILALTYGTNLLFYLLEEPLMSHAYSFTLFALFVFYTDLWYREKNFKSSVGLGLIGGLIVLVRPTNALLLIFFVLYGVKSFRDLRSRFFELVQNWNWLSLIMLIVFLWWIPQMFYWHEVAGKHWVFSYSADERFFFGHPHIIKGLFGFRKGWFLYNPVMIFAMAGIVLSYRFYREFFWPVLIYFTVMVYLLMSWWSWWFGGGLSIRAFIDFYPVLAIPLAISIQRMLYQTKWKKVVLLSVFLVFALKGTHYTMQMHYGGLHYDSNTKESYLSNFFHTKAKKGFYEKLKAPDYDKSKRFGREDVDDEGNIIMD